MIIDQTEIALAGTPARAQPAKREVTNNSRLGRMLRTVFSFHVVRVVLLVMMAVLTFRGRFSATDTWWDLKTGELIWNTHSAPAIDEFSYTTNRHAVVPHEWLAQLSIYAAYHFGGYVGMALWFFVFVSLLSITGYALCWLYSGSGRLAFFCGLGIWFFATIGYSIRAQLIGYVLLLFELLIVWFGRTRNPKWFFLLPPVFALWVNCHGSFLLGLVVLGAILACSFVEFRSGLLVAQRWTTKQRKVLAAAFALSVAALFINPAGVAQLTYPIDTMFNQPIQKQFISEWPPAPFSDPRAWGLLAIAGLVLLVPLFKRLEVTLLELVLVALGFGLAAQHQRMVIVFGILTMPIACRLLTAAWNQGETNRDRVLLNAVVIVIAIFAMVRLSPSSGKLTDEVNNGNPVKALAFVRHAGLSGRMLNDYNYGGYLIWAAPERKVFADGRGDVYEWTGVLNDYMKWATLKDDPKFLLNKYSIDYCLLAREAPITRVMKLLPEWKSVYSDDMSVVFVRSAPSVGIKPK